MSKADEFRLDTPLLQLSPKDVWDIGSATQGTAVFGATGSGKTSGSGAAIARAFLSAGMGGLVMCAKSEERELWERYARETGRLQSLVIFSPQGYAYDEHGKRIAVPWKYNFLDNEWQRSGLGAGMTENIVNLFTRITEVAEGTHDIAGKEAFWERAMRQLVRNAVEMLSLGKGQILLKDLARFVRDAPTDPAEVKDTEWWQTSFCGQCIKQADAKPKTPCEQNDFAMAEDYWLHEYPKMSPRTRSSIVSTFTSMADQLLHGAAWELLCTDTTITPEACYRDGAVIILDMPIAEYQELGRIIQGILKYSFQRTILRRDTNINNRPIFLFSDEAQNFVTSYDYQYQSVARSARACTVYLTQNISNYYASLGGANSHDEALSLVGNFQTKVFHANGDPNTNQFAADVFGQRWIMAESYSANLGGQAPTNTAGGSQTVHYKILPAEFTTLRKGGVENNLEVEGIVFMGGRVWHATGDTYLKTMFKQG